MAAWGALAAASLARRLQAASAPQAGSTSLVTRSAFPSTVQSGSEAPAGRSVAWAASPPARSRTRTWRAPPPRFERNAIRLPSGENAGAGHASSHGR